ncbi:hypothetical protein PENARI_c004G00240 [Penicillium arizonense]|uniref:Uncharacterized protein n=1 Tax=Penicillium arizonense TaxID=1835702 RepID=A0A1F5LRU4_PENAI|nr:hypothetical protein PENARI_c004G00240 [Penicillium arizonense]OGE55750.1 hypothetical protein PENARI_c004G00240 [Penicillium arizonense]
MPAAHCKDPVQILIQLKADPDLVLDSVLDATALQVNSDDGTQPQYWNVPKSENLDVKIEQTPATMHINTDRAPNRIKVVEPLDTDDPTSIMDHVKAKIETMKRLITKEADVLAELDLLRRPQCSPDVTISSSCCNSHQVP